MPKDQRTKWREAKQRYRDRVKTGQAGNTEETQEVDTGSFWTS